MSILKIARFALASGAPAASMSKPMAETMIDRTARADILPAMTARMWIARRRTR
jgi:hypothetical protein